MWWLLVKHICIEVRTLGLSHYAGHVFRPLLIMSYERDVSDTWCRPSWWIKNAIERGLFRNAPVAPLRLLLSRKEIQNPADDVAAVSLVSGKVNVSFVAASYALHVALTSRDNVRRAGNFLLRFLSPSSGSNNDDQDQGTVTVHWDGSWSARKLLPTRPSVSALPGDSSDTATRVRGFNLGFWRWWGEEESSRERGGRCELWDRAVKTRTESKREKNWKSKSRRVWQRHFGTNPRKDAVSCGYVESVWLGVRGTQLSFCQVNAFPRKSLDFFVTPFFPTIPTVRR